MKCVSCSIDVSPNFVIAIMDNKCPACGKQLIEGSSYKKLLVLRKQLSSLNLGVDDNVVIKISAAISSKFELWPKETSAEIKENNLVEQINESTIIENNDEDMEDEIDPRYANATVRKSPVKPSLSETEKMVNDIYNKANGFDDPDDGDEDYENLSLDERQSLIKEYGLDVGDKAITAGLEAPKERNSYLERALLDSIPLTSPLDSPMGDRVSRARDLQATTNLHTKGPKRIK